MTAPSSEPLWDVVEEHLDEAEFLWEQWEHSLLAPNYTLAEVAQGPEERLMAHVDGLVVNGPLVAERLLLPTLEDPDADPCRVRAAALALLQTPGNKGIDAVIAALHDQVPQRPEIVRALEYGASEEALRRLHPLLDSKDADLYHAVARVLTFHGEAFEAALPRLLESERGVDRGLGLRLVPRLVSWRRHVREVLAGMRSEDPELRDSALTAGAVLGLPQAWDRARELALGTEPDAGRSLLLLALRGEPTDHAAVIAATMDETLRGAALWSLGHLGTTSAVEAAVPWLEDAVHARVAGEAVSAITGLDLEGEGLIRPDEDDQPLEHHPEDDLPRPDPIGVLLWWRQNRGRFVEERRFVAGEPRNSALLYTMLRDGSMRRRSAHLMALQLAAPPGSGLYFELLAPSARQMRELATLQNR